MLALPAAGVESYVLAGQWSFDAKDDGYLERAGGITGDAEGQIYIVDRDAAEVNLYSASGVYLRHWGAPGKEKLLFSDPADVSLDPNGALFVADTGNGRIQAFTQGCNLIAAWTGSGSGRQFRRPVDVAVLRKGKTYVADIERPEILVVDEDGKVAGTIGAEGDGDGELRRPRALDLDAEGNLYVLDETLARVTKFGRDGAFVLRFGTKGSGEGQLDRPEGLDVDTGGNVYVADSGNGRVVKFDPNGKVLAVFGSRGSGDGQFEKGPFAVWVDTPGTVYVPDVARHGVQVFRRGPDATVSTPGANATAPANGTAANGTCVDGTCPADGALPNGTANVNRTPAALTPDETVTAVNITPYGTPTPIRSLPAPAGAVVAALAALGLLSGRRRR